MEGSSYKLYRKILKEKNSQPKPRCIIKKSNPFKFRAVPRKITPNIKNVTARTDNKAPPLIVETLLKSGKLANDFIRLKEIHEQNLDILFAIDLIKRRRRIDACYNPMAGTQCSKLQATIVDITRYEKENIEIFKRIVNAKPKFPISELECDWRKNIEKMKEKAMYPLILPGLTNSITDELLEHKSIVDLDLPRVFLEFQVKDGRTLGRVSIMLFSGTLPITCRRFYDYCLDNKHPQKLTNLNFVGTSVYRIFPKLYAEMGIIELEDTTFGKYKEENYSIDHEYTGTVAMIRNPDRIIKTAFTISFKPLSVMNGQRVAFGRVITGINVLRTLESSGANHGKPKEEIIISKTGILTIFPDDDDD